MKDWDQQLKEQVQRKFDNYRIVRIALDAALDNQEFVAPGNVLIVQNASSKTAAATVRFARNVKESINLVKGAKIYNIFTSFFITCAAQPGAWIEVLAGIDFDVKYECSGEGEVQPAIVVTNAQAATNTVAAAYTCKLAMITALSANQGTSWANIGAAAVSGSCNELLPGDSITVSISNTSEINVLFDSAGDKVIVTYEV